MDSKKILGKAGEDFATYWIKKRGFKILTKNYHAQAGEIDIVTFDRQKKIYVMIEVKTRKNDAFGDGIESITRQKLQKIEKAAIAYFLKETDLDEIPVFEIHAMVLRPNPEKGFWTEKFLVEYYDDLS